MRPVPRDGDPWGVLAPLRETIWGQFIQIIPGDVFSEALYGHTLPFIRMLGNPPKVHSQRIPLQEGKCREYKDCILVGPHCRPGQKLPECYTAPHRDIEVARLASEVALAWREGRYVLVVDGDEFVI